MNSSSGTLVHSLSSIKSLSIRCHPLKLFLDLFTLLPNGQDHRILFAYQYQWYSTKQQLQHSLDFCSNYQRALPLYTSQASMDEHEVLNRPNFNKSFQIQFSPKFLCNLHLFYPIDLLSWQVLIPHNIPIFNLDLLYNTRLFINHQDFCRSLISNQLWGSFKVYFRVHVVLKNSSASILFH